MNIHLGNFVIKEYTKIEALYKRKKFTATNDFVIRNRTPVHALRFEVQVNEKKLPQLIGDGIVVSTCFGSTGYFESITGEKFNKGLGLAFNNTTTNRKHMFLDENSTIKLKIIRHRAHFGVDNDPEIQTISPGETITFRSSKQVAKIVRII